MRVLRKMTRRKVTHFNFTPVTMGDIEKRIRDITSKPSFSTCEISYEVLKKMKNIVKKPILHMTNKCMKPGHFLREEQKKKMTLNRIDQ